MAIKNIDEEAARIFTPIKFIIDGKEYTVTKVEQIVLEDLMSSAENPRQMREAFAALVNHKKDEFKHTDNRKLTLAMRHITNVTGEQIKKLDSKNVPKEGATKSR